MFIVADRQNRSVVASVNTVCLHSRGKDEGSQTQGGHYSKPCGTPDGSSQSQVLASEMNAARSGGTPAMDEEVEARRGMSQAQDLSEEAAEPRRRLGKPLLKCPRLCSENGPTPE